MRRASFCLLLCLTLLALPLSPVQASHCQGINLVDPRRGIAQADAAFIGTYIQPQTMPTAFESKFRVEQALKGTIPRVIEVVGIPVDLPVLHSSVPIGVLLYKDDGRWHSGLCSVFEPDLLLRAAAPLPQPDGEGRTAFLVGGSFGEARTLALDASGRTLAYGLGTGETEHLSICPGAERAAEVAMKREGLSENVVLGIRDMASFELIREQTFPEFDADRRDDESVDAIGAVLCRDRAGEDVLLRVLKTALGDVYTFESRIVRARPDGATVLLTGEYGSVAFSDRNAAYANGGADARDIFKLDLARRTQRRIARIPGRGIGSPDLAVSPRASTLATVISGRYANVADRLVLIHTATGQMTQTPLEQGLVAATMAWADESSIVVGVFRREDGSSEEVRVYHSSLKLKGTFSGWTAYNPDPAVVNGIIYGIGQGSLISARLPRGPVAEIRRFDSPIMWRVIAVPPEAPRLARRSVESPAYVGTIIEEPTPPAGRPARPPQAGELRGWLIGLAASVALALAAAGVVLIKMRRRAS